MLKSSSSNYVASVLAGVSISWPIYNVSRTLIIRCNNLFNCTIIVPVIGRTRIDTRRGKMLCVNIGATLSRQFIIYSFLFDIERAPNTGRWVLR